MINILGNILILFFVLAIHELGHLLIGLLQGFRFELFVVGPLGIKRENNRIKMYLNKDIQYYGGAAATLPRSTDPNNGKIFANILLAGPIASLLLAIILGIIYYFFDLQFSKFLGLGALASFGIFLATTIPNKTGMFFTDRKRYQRLTSNGPERQVELAVLRLTGIYGRDSSYTNADEKDIELMIADPDYKYLGLFTKLSFQFEKNGYFESETKNEFDHLSQEMPKSLVQSLNKELDKLRT